MMLKEKAKLLRSMREKMEEEMVFVEGEKDVKAVEKTFEVKAISVQGIKPERVAEKHSREINGKNVLLLFDFDSEGKRKAVEYESVMQASGARIDRQGRRAFRRLFRLRTLEELPFAMKELETELN